MGVLSFQRSKTLISSCGSKADALDLVSDTWTDGTNSITTNGQFRHCSALTIVDEIPYQSISPIRDVRDAMTCLFFDWGVAHIYASFNDTFVHVGHTRQWQNGTPSLGFFQVDAASHIFYSTKVPTKDISELSGAFEICRCENPSLRFTSCPFLFMSFISRSYIWI